MQQWIKIVLMILRGAMDGLRCSALYADPDYRNLRAALVLGENDGPDDPRSRWFGLHPRLFLAEDLGFDQGELAVVHAVGDALSAIDRTSTVRIFLNGCHRSTRANRAGSIAQSAWGGNNSWVLPWASRCH